MLEAEEVDPAIAEQEDALAHDEEPEDGISLSSEAAMADEFDDSSSSYQVDEEEEEEDDDDDESSSSSSSSSISSISSLLEEEEDDIVPPAPRKRPMPRWKIVRQGLLQQKRRQ